MHAKPSTTVYEALALLEVDQAVPSPLFRPRAELVQTQTALGVATMRAPRHALIAMLNICMLWPARTLSADPLLQAAQSLPNLCEPVKQRPLELTPRLLVRSGTPPCPLLPLLGEPSLDVTCGVPDPPGNQERRRAL